MFTRKNTMAEVLDNKTEEILAIIEKEKPLRKDLAQRLGVSEDAVRRWITRNNDRCEKAKQVFYQSGKGWTPSSSTQKVLEQHKDLIFYMIRDGKTSKFIIDDLNSQLEGVEVSERQLRHWKSFNKDAVAKAVADCKSKQILKSVSDEEVIFKHLDNYQTEILVMREVKLMQPKYIAIRLGRLTGVHVTGLQISQYLSQIPQEAKEEISSHAQEGNDEFYDTDASILDDVIRKNKKYIETLPPPQPNNYDMEDAVRENVLVAPLTDLHIGEIVRSRDVRNRNEYNLDIARRRLEYWHDSILEYGRRNKTGVLKIPMLGDLVNGELHHQGFDVNNEVGAIVQQMITVQWLKVLLQSFAKNFEFVEIYNVVGNHGRSPKQRFMPNYDFQNNFDYAVVDYLEHMFSNYENVVFNNSMDIYNVMQLGDKRAILMHGYQKGTGPNAQYPAIIEKLRRIIPEEFDYLMIGHYHHLHTSSIGYRKKFFVCGTLKGVDGYARNDKFLDGDPEHYILTFDRKGDMRECGIVNFMDLPKRKKGLLDEVHKYKRTA